MGIGAGALIAGLFGMNVRTPTMFTRILLTLLTADKSHRALGICILRHVIIRFDSRYIRRMGRFSKVFGYV